MAYAWRWIRSLFFIGQMYLMMPVLALFYTPMAIFKREWAFHAVHAYCRWVRFSARWIVGLKSEIRGPVPEGEVIIASKHQSFFDIILIVSVVPRPRFVMKHTLKYAPILGWYGKRIGCVPVNRGRRTKAIEQMVEGVKAATHPGQLIIFPQGTRVAPGADRPYKVGVGILYRELQQTVVPAATNVGVFWPRHGIYRKPGVAVVEFLPSVEPGMPMDAFMKHLEVTIEEKSDQLMADAGFVKE